MFVCSCEARGAGFLSRLGAAASGRLARLLVAACLTAAWVPTATCLVPTVAAFGSLLEAIITRFSFSR